jgi:hypothetical protein
MVDLTAGIFAMLVAVLVAHSIFIPKLNSRSALAFVAISLFCLLAVAATLAVFPSRIYLAGLVYVVVFISLAGVASRSSPNKPQLWRRAAAGSAFMFLSVAVAWWLAFAPR